MDKKQKKQAENLAFIKMQYEALREEIDESKERIFKITLGGTITVPAAEFLGNAYDIPIIIIIAPFLVITLMLIYLAENNGIMRAGRYIRKEIEPLFPQIQGWETWLESAEPGKRDKRSHEKYMNYGFNVLWAFYYLVASYLAVALTFQYYGMLGIVSAISIYLSVGLFFYFYMIRFFQKSTKND